MSVMVGTEPRPVPAPLPGLWTFWADRYVSPGVFEPVGPLQATSFNCIRRLSGFGTGDIIIVTETASLTRAELLRLWGWRLWAYYGDPPRPVWCGMPNGITDDGRAVISFTLAEVTGYLRKRQWDLAGSYGTLVGSPATHRRYDQVEQVNIARDLAAPVADVGVAITTSPGPGFPRDRSMAFLEGESRGQLLVNLAGVIEGPEWRTNYYTGNDGLPRAELAIAYPRVGSDLPGLGATVPGTAVDYTLKWDADEFRTRTYAVGEAPESVDGVEQPKISHMTDRPQAGFPRLDEVDDWPGVTVMSTLQERAETSATIYATPTLDASVNVPAIQPPYGTYGPGDTVHLLITGPLQPDGFEIEGRLTELSVNARESRCGWTVSVTEPPGQPRQTLTQQLADLRRLATGVFRWGAAPA